MGFAGFRIIGDMPSFEPDLPGHWRNMKFSLKWRTCDLRVTVSNKKIKLFVSSNKKGSMMVKCFGSVHKILLNKEYVINKR